MLIAVTVELVGFSDIALVILTCDVGILVAVLTFEQRTRKLMKQKESKALIKFESPLDWLKSSTIFAFVSLMSSLTYEIMISLSIETNFPVFGNNSLLFYTIGFFIFGVIYLVRTAIFMIDPSSKANIFVGKIIYMSIIAIIKVGLLGFVALFQYINALMFSLFIQGNILQQIMPEPIMILYALTIVFSFVGMVPLTYGIAFRLDKKMNRLEIVAIMLFVSPWVVLFTVNGLISLGIKLV